MSATLTLRFTFDNQQYELKIPRPNPKQYVCDLGEPLVRGVWGNAFVLNSETQPEWKTNENATPEG